MRAIKTLAVIGACTLISACSSTGISGLSEVTTSKFVGEWYIETACDDGSTEREKLSARPGPVPLTFLVDYTKVRTYKDGRQVPYSALIRGESTFDGVVFVDSRANSSADRALLFAATGKYLDNNTLEISFTESSQKRSDLCKAGNALLRRVTSGSAAKQSSIQSL